MKIYFTDFTQVYYETDTNSMVGCTNENFLRYVKGVHTNKERLVNRFVNPLKEKVDSLKTIGKETEYNSFSNFLDEIVNGYENAKPFSFKESFTIKEREFQALVFASINIGEMIQQLGAKRIKTDGIEVTHKQYDSDGNFTGMKSYHNVYEVHEVNGEKLGVNGSMYVVKCWCTSTNKEHWIWIEDQYKDDPLSAIASTFRVHKNIIPYIKCLKRQGDLLLIEMNKEVHPEGEIVPLTKEQYFKLLVAQS